MCSSQLSGRRLRMSGVVPWKDMRGSAAAAARRSSLLSDRVRMWRASVFEGKQSPGDSRVQQLPLVGLVGSAVGTLKVRVG